MCGIFCEISENSTNVLKQDCNLQQCLSNRGPNHMQSKFYALGKKYTGLFCGSVLWMQGCVLSPQPIEDDSGVLLYNGDIFDESWNSSASDTEIIFKKLGNIEKDHVLSRHCNILKVLKSLKGPFSILYYDKIGSKLYFTRDRIGRNSLLFHQNDTSLIISSVLGRKYNAFEIPATHICLLDLDAQTISLHSWEGVDENYDIKTWIKNLKSQQTLSDEEFQFDFKNNIELNDDENVINFVESTVQNITCKISIMKTLLSNEIIKKAVSKLRELLERSIKLRLRTQPQKCKNCIDIDISSCDHCTVGILFSGGLDCTILAYLADKFLGNNQPIDLINVAFNKDHSNNYNVPDRITGEQSYEELKRLCPNRKWLFRKVNIPLEELESKQQSVIADLIYPRQTILDESLGSALWFAARAQDDESVSPCRILILGSGADELFGGYTRHRNAFKRHGWVGLQKELTLDWKRISYRNLARDNRVICDHGRQPRMPYLDEQFTDWVLNLKPWLRCFPSNALGPGIGDKLILRLLAFELDLNGVALFPKRALQFGSRIANKKEKGNSISKHFLM